MKDPKSTVLKSAIVYKIGNNPVEKMHVSEIQLEKFTRQNMNINKNFFYFFLFFNSLECFHQQLYAIQTHCQF